MKRVRGWLGGILRPERGEVEGLREELEDLRAEVGHLRRQLHALQEREAILNAQVLHLGRYTSEGNGAGVSQIGSARPLACDSDACGANGGSQDVPVVEEAG